MRRIDVGRGAKLFGRGGDGQTGEPREASAATAVAYAPTTDAPRGPSNQALYPAFPRPSDNALKHTMYAQASLTDLAERTDYEAWLLEAIYEIADLRIAAKDVDEIIYPPEGGPFTQVIYGVGGIRIGDWRPGFLDAGAPLVFVTAFKLLDMLMEWVLVENGLAATHKFVQKIAALKGAVTFPGVIENRLWFRQRLLALYEQFEPLRGTIIHARHFKSANGALEVASSKWGKVGPAITITASDLRNLSLVLLSTLRWLQGTWAVDALGEKRVRRALDELATLHTLPSLGQLPPAYASVRLYVPHDELLEIDLAAVRKDIAWKRPGQDVVFSLRLIVVSRDGGSAFAFLVPWDELQGASLRKRPAELAPWATGLPPDFDLITVATKLGLVPAHV